MYVGYNASKLLSKCSFISIYAANVYLHRTCNNQADAAVIQVLTASDFQQYGEGTFYSQQLSQTRKAETQKQYADETLQAVRREVLELEVALGITTCWSPHMPEYKAATEHIHTQEYQEALDNVERLVCQRLFELQKLNISQTGKLFHFTKIV